MEKTKVIIVDDSSTYRGLFRVLLSSDPGIEVLATAEDPGDAREKIKKFNPDVIMLDVEMPKMDGITFLEKIMTTRSMPVVMVSSLTTRGADIILQALEMGAVDYIAKPETLEGGDFAEFKEELLHKVKYAAHIAPKAHQSTPPIHSALTFSSDNTRQLIAIGASTGGVEAIHTLLQHMPATSPAIVIAQHMPEVFTASFARRMNNLSAMTVHEAAEGNVILPGHVYIAAGNKQFEVRQKGAKLYCHLHDGPPVSGHKPSVDVLFHSVAKIQDKQLVGVILTGMGHDGAEGLRAMRKAGAKTLGQNEASCVVYGMPKAARKAGGVAKELPLSDMPHAILQLCLP